MRRVAVVALATGLLLAVSSSAAAAPADIANDVAADVMSPFCPGSTLHDCSSAEAQDLRDEILARADNGWSRTRILSWLEDEYGPSIRSTPATEGAGWLAWLLPLAVVIGGAAMAWAFLRRSTSSGGAPPSTQVTRSERSDLERELRALRGRP
ncbi:MAG: cytochrome c-type biogenesis protein CcmH [Actinomycetota bacterium]|nr:cytochrome c-type biogenesis protein CcmH [Actinomycetota bacterium]